MIELPKYEAESIFDVMNVLVPDISVRGKLTKYKYCSKEISSMKNLWMKYDNLRR